MHRKLKIILLAGPTASGKSKVAISLVVNTINEIHDDKETLKIPIN